MSANTKRMIHVALRGLGFTTVGFLLATSGLAGIPRLLAIIESTTSYISTCLRINELPTMDST
uniref:Uncharacterized protein n=1 Tax=Candidatus Kentrum eta TaxID=2126337 RepID=A0A450UN45_9GAMM|nr:MAG: hypothetical protein BECKH772A_GA0070896_1003021 [Candidatus Kentron sp. H]VFJ93968.1 MAG: hypothetical protein BECKH772B_GA0070898_1005312 [Candidatus Kentron sp. H]VFJ99161.1 MAG: hypothetical protein BECKH772C_GA0070978_1002912 [Candidatus Kentron sp. H]